jgi:hypothetical protein
MQELTAITAQELASLAGIDVQVCQQYRDALLLFCIGHADNIHFVGPYPADGGQAVATYVNGCACELLQHDTCCRITLFAQSGTKIWEILVYTTESLDPSDIHGLLWVPLEDLQDNLVRLLQHA